MISQVSPFAPPHSPALPLGPLHVPQPLRVALLFNANEVVGREIVAGIGAYFSSTRNTWDLFLEDDLRSHPWEMRNWSGDGIIADFNDPDISAALTGCTCPVVAVGSSYADRSAYPQDIPYVATDDFALVRQAHEHLLGTGIHNFAMYSVPQVATNRWAQERETAFKTLLQRSGSSGEVFRGESTHPALWRDAMSQLVDWLRNQPKPLGVIAVNDVRARHVMQACLLSGIAVPEEVAIVGIDNDPLTQTLSRIPLTSVKQGSHEMGRTAASLLHRVLRGGSRRLEPILIPPTGIHIAASSQHQRMGNPYVMRACCFIRQYAAQGIKSEQVADHLKVARSTLDAHFRKELGHTVHDEILRTKLERACALLREGNTGCAGIAEQCGFTTLQYMHAVFRRELGCTPREYQAKHATSATPE